MADDTHARYWWERKVSQADDVYQAATSYVEWLEQVSAQLYWVDRVHSAMYENRLLSGAGKFSGALSVLRHSGFTSTRLRVSSSIVDTVTAKIGKNKPAVKINPSNADWSLKRKGRMLQKFIRGKSEELEVQAIAPQILRDACVYGTGCVKVSIEFGEMCIDRIPRDELFVDPREAKYGKPRQIHHRRQMSREVLQEMFPKQATQIKEAESAEILPDDEDLEGWTDTDMISVYESWHLPSGPDAKDGRHTICIKNATLLFEEWTRPRFPLIFLRYANRLKGFWGRGLMEDLAELQYAINETVRDVQMAIYWGSQLKVLSQRGSGINKSALGRNQRPVVVEYTGTKPTWEAPNPVSGQQVEFLKQLIAWAHEFTGVSEMSVSAKNPLGAGASAVALQEFYDIESERLSQQEQSFARFFVDLAEVQIDTAREIAKSDGGKGYKAKYGDKNVMEQINWADVDLKDDVYNLTLEAASFLPDTRAGKLEVSERLYQSDLIDANAAMALFGGAPDIERVMRSRNAPREQVEYIIERLEDPDVDMFEVTPDAYMDLVQAIPMIKAELARACTEKAPEEVKDNYRTWIGLAVKVLDSMKQAEAAAQLPPPPQPGMPPEGMPMDPGMPMEPGMMPPEPMAGPAPMPGPAGMPPPMPGVPQQ